GPDGHCASLFPEHPAVYEQEASVVAVRNAPKPPPTRLSLTFRALDAANEVWFIASGEGKATAVALALSGAGRVQVPAAGPRGRHRTLWLIDRPAAAELPANLYKPPLA
ncbi:MAG: 6-phosphogluconolactonase, partial [Pseudonocardiales bacterium]|nr:6-phosphogluconolactonase [Pseudonocardiales bacterium]